MTLTRHGHHINFTPIDDEDPNPQRARCGGPGVCRRCTLDSGNILLADVAIGPDGLVTGLPTEGLSSTQVDEMVTILNAVSPYPPEIEMAALNEDSQSDVIKSEMIPLKLITSDDPTRKVLEEIFAERVKQRQVGYDEVHDDTHNASHFYRELSRRLEKLRGVHSSRRSAAVKMAAVCVALIEYWDRRESRL